MKNYHCKVCGEDDEDEFYRGRKSKCKQCEIKKKSKKERFSNENDSIDSDSISENRTEIFNEKKYRIKLTEEEIKPKSPIREREVDFQDYIVRNMNILLKKIEGLENENKELKTKLETIDGKFESSDKTIINLAKTIENKTLSHEEKMKKIAKIQEENPNSKYTIERINSDGIVRISHNDGSKTYMI